MGQQQLKTPKGMWEIPRGLGLVVQTTGLGKAASCHWKECQAYMSIKTGRVIWSREVTLITEILSSL